MGRAQRKAHQGAHGPSNGRASDDVDREMRADIDAGDGDDGHSPPGQASVGPGQIRAGNRGHRGRNGDVRGRESQARVGRAVQQDMRQHDLGRFLVDDRLQQLRHEPRGRRPNHEQAGEAQPVAQQRDDRQRRRRPQRPELHCPQQRRTDSRRKFVDQPKEVDLDDRRPVLARQHRGRDHQTGGNDEPQPISRVVPYQPFRTRRHRVSTHQTTARLPNPTSNRDGASSTPSATPWDSRALPNSPAWDRAL